MDGDVDRLIVRLEQRRGEGFLRDGERERPGLEIRLPDRCALLVVVSGERKRGAERESGVQIEGGLERVDGKLILPEAVKLLSMKSA